MLVKNSFEKFRATVFLWRRNTSGLAAIEFTLFAPVFLIILVAVIEVGFTMYQAMQVYNSVEAGMLYAAKNTWNSAGISAAVVNATGTSGVAAVPAPVQFCGCPTALGVIEVTCNSPCADGNLPGQYIRISAALSHSTILPYPGLQLPTTLTAQSIVRLN